MATETAHLIHLGGDVYAHPSLADLLTPIDRLAPHPRNPRHGNLATITDSIRANGLYRPIYAQRSTGHILGGSHTYAAAHALGATGLPVVWLDVDEQQAARILLVDNRSADLGLYDDAPLADLLAQIADQQDTLDGTGYALEDLDDLLASITPVSGDELAALTNPSPAGASEAAGPAGLEPPAGDPHVKADSSYADFYERYAERATRSLVLPYNSDRYAWVIEHLGQLRREHGLDSHSAVLAHLLAEATGQTPPPETGPEAGPEEDEDEGDDAA